MGKKKVMECFEDLFSTWHDRRLVGANPTVQIQQFRACEESIDKSSEHKDMGVGHL